MVHQKMKKKRRKKSWKKGKGEAEISCSLYYEEAILKNIPIGEEMKGPWPREENQIRKILGWGRTSSCTNLLHS